MASFNVVNYSLRPSKSIQRQVVFGGIRLLQDQLRLEDLVYIGLGSIWFIDFIMAHKVLEIDNMVSIEQDALGYRRAQFNAPFSTVDVRHGSSSDVLPLLFDEPAYNERPWIIWLDYDGVFDETLREDVRVVVENAPENSIMLLTFSCVDRKYGHGNERPNRLRELFGDLVPSDLPKSACSKESLQNKLADFTMDFIKSVAVIARRPGGFVPGFRILYKDSAPMVTVGGMLPSLEYAANASAIISADFWRCLPRESIVSPHLTLREALVLQSKLPNPNGLSRPVVQSLGFDLEDEQIRVYEQYYREYPAFAQIVT